jgi:hypothetical protein
MGHLPPNPSRVSDDGFSDVGLKCAIFEKTRKTRHIHHDPSWRLQSACCLEVSFCEAKPEFGALCWVGPGRRELETEEKIALAHGLAPHSGPISGRFLRRKNNGQKRDLTGFGRNDPSCSFVKSFRISERMAL